MPPPPQGVPDYGYGATAKLAAPAGDGHKLGALAVSKGLTIALFIVSVFTAGLSMRVLPGSFRALEMDIGLRPWQLAALNSCQGLGAAFSCLIWGALADHGLPRRWIVGGCVAVGGAANMCFAFCSSFLSMAALQVILGLTVGFQIIPTTTMPELVSQSHIGVWLGALMFAAVAGAMVSLGVSTALSTETVLGFDGWRVLFVGIGAFGVGVGTLVGAFVRPPLKHWRLGELNLLYEIRSFCRLCRIPSLALVLVANMFFAIPINVLTAFLPLFFQYSGVPNSTAGVLVTVHMCARALSGPVGGQFGDVMARWSLYHGRPLVGQAAALACILTLCLALVIVGQPWVTFSMATANGLFQIWPWAGCHGPIMIALVDSDLLGAFFGWSGVLSNLLGFALGPPVAALLAERAFGYQVRTEASIKAGKGRDTWEMPAARQEANSVALSKSMLWCCVVPWVVCFLLFCLVHRTFRGDSVARAQAKKTGSETPSSCATA